MLSQEVREQVLRHVDGDKAVEYVRRLLKIRSFSRKEKEKAEYLTSTMKNLGLESFLQEVEPGRPNAIGRARGKGGGNTLILNGHIDHNMVVEGWTKDPFAAVVENGWLYGFVHMQSADGAYLAALEAVLNSDLELRGDVLLQFVVGELQGGVGTKHAIKEGLLGDYYIVGEPSNLSIITQHSGHMVMRVNTIGRAKHYTAKLPPGQKGVSAIEHMVKVIQALGKSHTQIAPGGWLTFRPRNDWLGWPQINVGVIKGGIGRDCEDWRPALLPDFCTALVDFRAMPGQNADTVKQDLVNLLEKIRKEEPDLRYEVDWVSAEGFPDEGFEEPLDTPVFQAVYDAHQAAVGSAPQINGEYPKVTDASHLSKAGIRGIIYGPSGKFTSRPDERVEVSEIVTAAKTYALAIAEIATQRKK
ncbi:MAG: M20/M25/M40 family metallo-hydrolase [Thaumarchaeota archaeon]|nr:M20/M25/M40 family metallo-hydrolase [Nitrososphaerota archaeon]